MNPSLAALSGPQRVLAEASLKLDFSGPDRADENLLNQIIWHAAKGHATPYPKKGVELLLPGDMSFDLSMDFAPFKRRLTSL
jgi:hypothetical protein